MSLSVHTSNKRKDILVLRKESTQGLDNTTLTSEAIYSINLTESEKNICIKYTLSWKRQFLIC